MLTQQCNRSIQLRLRNAISTREDDGGSGFNLIIVEFTKILHVDLHLASIGNGHLITQDNILTRDLLYSSNHIAKLTDARRFDHNAIRMILLNHLGQSLAEITHQAAANAAGIHLCNIDTGVLQETTVDANFAKFIFDQNQIFALVGFLDHFLNQSGFTGTKKTGINIDLSHK